MRPSYEARLVLVAATRDTLPLVHELEGAAGASHVLAPALDGQSLEVRSSGTTEPVAASRTAGDLAPALRGADIAVLVLDRASPASPVAMDAVRLARSDGCLVAALVSGAALVGGPSLADARAVADVVVNAHSRRMMADVLDAWRGGAYRIDAPRPAILGGTA